MSDNILFLHPRDPGATFDIAPLADALRSIGFIGNRLEFRGRTHYKPGDEFLYLLSFLGCSPVVSLGEPGLTGREFCHIEFTFPGDKPTFAAGENIKVPRCRHCNQRIDDWKDLIGAWEVQGKTEWRCPQCSTTTPLHRLKWKHCAGFGRQFIKIWGIFEGEAVPGEILMDTLHKACAIEWDYFYLRTLEISAANSAGWQ